MSDLNKTLDSELQLKINGITCIVGLFIVLANLSVLIHLAFIQKKNGFFYLVFTALFSLLAIAAYIINCVLELDMAPRSKESMVYQWYMGMGVCNGFMFASHNIVLCLCLDRAIALHRPLYYQKFTKSTRRSLLVLLSLFLGFGQSSDWFGRHEVFRTNHSWDHREREEFILRPLGPYGIFWRVLGLLIGLSMILLTGANIVKTMGLQRKYRERGRVDAAWEERAESHKTSLKICVALILLWLFSTPLDLLGPALVQHSLKKEEWYHVFLLFTNTVSLLALEGNLFLFSIFSREYRRTASYILCCKWARPGASLNPITRITQLSIIVRDFGHRARGTREIDKSRGQTSITRF